MFSVWPKNQPKTTEIDFSRYFHFKSFPPLSHTHDSVKPSLRCQAFTAPEPPTPTHHDRDLAGHRNCADRRRSRSRSRWSRSRQSRSRDRRFVRSRSRRSASIAIIEIREIAIAISPRKYAVLLGFIWVFRNEWHYVFVWELRKCEQQVKNVFSIVFSRIQPNIRKYFPKIFLKCNQTHENIFFSGK